MTLEEAHKVAAILAQAHGTCGGCVGELVAEARISFPEFEWATDHDRPEVLGREDWKEIMATWEAAWPAGTVDVHLNPCPVRVRMRP